MDYLSERRRRRRRKHRSPSPYGQTSSREDDDEIEQEIIDRAMDIERSREKNLRRQLEYIVQNVKELERRRHHRHRTHSPEYDHRPVSPPRHRSFARTADRNSSSERYYQTNDSSYSERRHRSSPKSGSCQITMLYQGHARQRQGDEIMVLQDNIIVFKGFLQPEEPFTFKFQQRHRQLNVNLEFFINELFDCSLSIDCERQQLEQETDFFQLQSIQLPERNRREEVNGEQERTNGTERSHHSRRPRRSHTSSSSTIHEERRSTDGHGRHQRTSKPYQGSKDRRTTSREVPASKQRSQRSPSPPQLPPKQRSENAKTNATQAPSSLLRQPSSKSSSATEKKPSKPPATGSDNDDNQKPSKQTTAAKPSYGPPQLSTFPRSSSDSSADEQTAKAESEKPSTVAVRESEPSSAQKDENEGEEESTEGEGFSNFLQLLHAMSGGGARAQAAGEDGDGIQGLLARLGIVTQGATRKKAANATPRQVGNVENFLLVYLDSSAPDESLLVKFRGLVNCLKPFDDADDCIAFINSISNEKVVLFVSDALGDPVVSRIQDLQQLFAIYVFCQTEEQADGWSSNQPKIRGISTDTDNLLDLIKRDIENEEENSLTLTYSLPDANTKNDPAFAINQIIKEILLDSDDMSEAKKELVDFARTEYENNSEQLEYIQQFEDSYQKENVLEFFRKHQFLYKMMNKAFRIPEADVLFKLRLFIQNLHHAIIASSTDSSVTTIYRAQLVSGDELESLKKCTDGTLLAFSHFFLASTERPESKSSASSAAAENNDEPENKAEEILFQIDVSNSNQYMSMENQILVTFGLVTRLGNIEKDKNGRTVVRLTTITSDDRQLERAVEPIRKETRAPHPSLRLVKLFIELEQYSQAVELGQALLASLPNARKDPLLALARTYHSLGTTLYEKEEYDQALDVIKKSHELYLRFLPEDAPQLSPTWNNMGSIYLRQGKMDLALEHHEKALSIQLKSPSPDLPSIISYSNNIGGVYLKLERFDEALVHFRRALQIEEQTLAANHPELAGTYHRIGGVYFRQNNYEKALEYYDRTLEIELASLPDTHPTVAVTYHNRGTAFEGLGKLEEAVESAEKAVERLLKTMPKEHPQVRMNQAYVDKLKQKLWVKQLFTS